MWFYATLVPGRTYPLDGETKVCICGAHVGLTEYGEERLADEKDRQAAAMAGRE